MRMLKILIKYRFYIPELIHYIKNEFKSFMNPSKPSLTRGFILLVAISLTGLIWHQVGRSTCKTTYFAGGEMHLCDEWCTIQRPNGWRNYMSAKDGKLFCYCGDPDDPSESTEVSIEIDGDLLKYVVENDDVEDY